MVKVLLPIVVVLIAVVVFLNFDAPVNTREALMGVVIERAKSTYGYRVSGTMDVAKIRLSNGVVVSYQRADLQVGDKVVYEVYRGKYTGREVYKPKPSTLIPFN